MASSDHWAFSIVEGKFHVTCPCDKCGKRIIALGGLYTWVEGTILMIGRKKPLCMYTFRYDCESDAQLNKDKVDILLSGAQK